MGDDDTVLDGSMDGHTTNDGWIDGQEDGRMDGWPLHRIDFTLCLVEVPCYTLLPGNFQGVLHLPQYIPFFCYF